MSYFTLTLQHIADYKRDGYIIVKDFLEKDEIARLSEIAFNDTAIRQHAIDLNDQTGKKTKLTSWYFPAMMLMAYSPKVKGLWSR